jgi:glycosyltransferase involved in cell wall biosynthesis
MRIGQNPAKQIFKVAQPRDLSIAVVNFIPVLSGFHEHSLEVLEACLESIRATTPDPFDLMVFDNHSCPEVRDYLTGMLKQDKIQYLVLSDTNIGKIGAWNFLFGAAHGEYVAYADSDILFRPGWLEDARKIFAAFPNVGMVTGCPVRNPAEVLAGTLKWGRKEGSLEEGTFVDWDAYLELALSIGWDEAKARQRYKKDRDYLLEVHGKRALAGAGHFQFVAPRQILQGALPLPSEAPMRGERALDQKINDLGYLRLCSLKPYVYHMGNQPVGQPATARPRPRLLRRLVWLPGIRHVLLWLYNQLFRLFFDSVQ